MFLSTADVARLTGLEQPAAQRRHLRSRGIPYETDAAGRPLVLVDEIERRLRADGKARGRERPSPRWDGVPTG